MQESFVHWGVRMSDKNISADSVKPHLHPADKAAVLAQSSQVNFRKRAADTSETPRQIYQAVTNKLEIEATLKLPSYDANRKAMQRERTKKGVPNNKPASLADIEVPDKLKKTTRGEQFLLHDSGPQDRERILVFAARENLKTLHACDVWYADGTFQSAPVPFYQVYTIHGKFHEKVIPLGYALLPNKSKPTYKRLFDVLEEETAKAVKLTPKDIGPKMMVVDFEKAVITAAEQTFGCDMKGCAFHFGQSIYGKIQASGQAGLYVDDLKFKLHCKMLLALAYLPERDVLDGWEQILAMEDLAIPADGSLIEYFQDTYIGTRDKLSCDQLS